MPRARHLAASWARALGADDETAGAVGLAVTEAVANVVRHAYPDSGGELELLLSEEPRALRVDVRDWGVGLDRARASNGGGGAGLGLLLVAEVCDGMDVVSAASGGTLVRMRFELAPAGPAG